MKKKLKNKTEKAELLGDSIFVSNEFDEGFYEFDSEEYALKVWMEILEEWRKDRRELLHTVDNICDSRKHSEHLEGWP